MCFSHPMSGHAILILVGDTIAHLVQAHEILGRWQDLRKGTALQQ